MIPLLVLAESMHWKVSLIQLQIENMMNWELDTYQLYIRNITNTPLFVKWSSDHLQVVFSSGDVFVITLLVLSSLLITLINFWCKNNTVSISKAANQHPIRTMAPLHNNQATNCGKLWQQIVSSFTKLENLSAMPVLNFALTHLMRKRMKKETSSAFQTEGFKFKHWAC